MRHPGIPVRMSAWPVFAGGTIPDAATGKQGGYCIADVLDGLLPVGPDFALPGTEQVNS